MITNKKITIYHKDIDEITRLEKWIRYNYSYVWWYESQSAKVNKGYNNENKLQIRIPYDKNVDLNINNFAKGDIIVKGTLETDIETQDDLKEYQIYNIKSINNNDFGNNQHIHIGGI